MHFQATILVVDDDVMNLDFTTELLRSQGYGTLSAEEGSAALHLAQTQHPNLILMDLLVPGTNGCEITRQLKLNSSTAAIPVIALTALTREEDHRAAIEAGCIAVITKPIQMDSFLKSIAGFLEDAG